MPSEKYSDRLYERKVDAVEPEFAVEQINDDFLARLRAASPSEDDLSLARKDFGEEVPEDVIEQIAKQRMVAQPLLDRYHLFHESTPTLALSRAANMKAIDEITDIVTAMDLSDMSDEGEFVDEYTCPRCAHRWSGAPNYTTGYGDKVYVPTGRISSRTGRIVKDRYGPPVKTVRNFKYGRNWRGSSAAKLPRGFGNRPIGTPIVGESWRSKRKKK